MKRGLIIFAKEPRMGKVKTRLEVSLSKARCLNLYKSFLRDTINTAKKLECEERFLAYESSGRIPGFLLKIAPSFILFRQKGRNLGEKMHNAFLHLSANKTSKIVIVGSDTPDLPCQYIEAAFCELDNHDLVLGPSHDGGYYLIGLKKPDLGLFRGIKWSFDAVFEDTLKNAGRLKKKTALLSMWYDIDYPLALDYLKCRLKENSDKNTAQWTRRSLRI